MVDDVYETFDGAKARLDGIRPICFLDDLTTKNVMVADGQLQGLVDFDCVCYGDTMYWLALAQVAVLSDVGQDSMFYVNELSVFGISPQKSDKI